VDLGNRRNVEAEAGIGGDHDVDLTTQLARKDGALDIAARELADRRVITAGLDPVARNRTHRPLAESRLIEPPTATGEGRQIEFARCSCARRRRF
jgi:hypothetical protein